MKTVSPFSPLLGSSEGLKQNQSEESNGVIPNVNDDSPSSNTDIESRVQGQDLSKVKHGPGNFIQKIFSQKSRSRSVPTLVKDKEQCVINETKEEVNGDVEPPEGAESSENWFKTWPDCVERKSTGSDEGAKDGVDANTNESPGHIPTTMDNMLKDLPLAYSPVTKQIVLRQNKEVIPGELIGNSHPPLHRCGTEPASFNSALSDCQDPSRPHSADSSSIGACSLASQESISDRPKRRGISSFFSRGVFSWKGKSEPSVHEASQGWSLFGSKAIARTADNCKDVSGYTVVGSSGLIQLERPDGLPAKSSDERRSHSSLQDIIIKSNRNRELKEAKERKRQLESQLKMEDEVSKATAIWTQEILPKWSTSRNCKKTQEMWWAGLPPGVRGRIWKLAISNNLNITEELYNICLQRAEERLRLKSESDSRLPESSMELIQLDISRTFPTLCIFQKGGPYYDVLHSVLAAYACYRPDLGYVQGMSFIAAILILNMEPADAFASFANLLNSPCLRAFYSLDEAKMCGYYKAYNELVKENAPDISRHLVASRLTPDLYLMDWIYTVFAKATTLDVACRLWDVFLRDGDLFLFRAAVGILVTSKSELMKMDFVSGSKYLTRLPEDLCPKVLFKSIAGVSLTVGKKPFQQVLDAYLPPE